MGMWNKAQMAKTAVRGLLLPCGLLGVLWPCFALPSLMMTAPAREISARVMADQRFKSGALVNIHARMEAAPRSEIMQSDFIQAEAFVALSAAEETMLRKSPEEIDRAVAIAESKVRASLSNRPTDSFLWLMLYSVATTQNGFDPQYLSWLDRSYAVGPREAWVALRRNRLSLAIFPILSVATQQAVLSEFAEIVDADFIGEAAATLMSVGWTHRTLLLPPLSEANIASRQSLARRLASEGLNVTVPGVDRDARPW